MNEPSEAALGEDGGSVEFAGSEGLVVSKHLWVTAELGGGEKLPLTSWIGEVFLVFPGDGKCSDVDCLVNIRMAGLLGVGSRQWQGCWNQGSWCLSGKCSWSWRGVQSLGCCDQGINAFSLVVGGPSFFHALGC